MDNFIETLGDLQKLNEYIEAEVSKRMKSNAERPYRSESIDCLAEALASAQGEFVPIPYNRTNASWNDEYSDLDIVFRYIRPILSKNKLAVNQWTELTNDGVTILHTELLHASGQFKESRTKIVPARNDVKTYDSALADSKRQQAISLLGVSLEGDPKDDDGNLAMLETHEEIASGTTTKLLRSKASYECITQEQADELDRELNGYTDLADELLTKYNIRCISDMPKSKFRFAIEQVRKFIMYRKGDSKSVR